MRVRGRGTVRGRVTVTVTVMVTVTVRGRVTVTVRGRGRGRTMVRMMMGGSHPSSETYVGSLAHWEFQQSNTGMLFYSFFISGKSKYLRRDMYHPPSCSEK